MTVFRTHGHPGGTLAPGVSTAGQEEYEAGKGVIHHYTCPGMAQLKCVRAVLVRGMGGSKGGGSVCMYVCAVWYMYVCMYGVVKVRAGGES